MATIPRTYLTTSKAGLDGITPKNGQFIIIWDSDEAYYDAPIDGTPSGTPIRRRISGVRVISELPANPDSEVLYAYIPESTDPDLRVWANDDWVIVGNAVPVTDTQVQTNTSDGKFYLAGPSSITDGTVGTLLKNANVYIDEGNLYVSNGDLYVINGLNAGTIHANLSGNATSADSTSYATTAGTAQSAVTDNMSPTPNNITSYLHDVSIDALSNELIFTAGDGVTTTEIQIPNSTYDVFDDVTDGLVPKSGSSASNKLLSGTGWESKSSITVGNATNATNATNDADGNEIAATYYADVSYTTGVGLTLTSSDGNTHKTVQLPISDYDVFAPDVNGLVPAPTQVQSEQDLFLKSDGTWDVSTTNDFVPATSEEAGIHGLVPAPGIGVDASYFLRGDKSWGSQFNTTYYGLVPPPLLADPTYSLRADGTWAQSASTDTKDTAGASQVQYGIHNQDEFTGDGETTVFTLSETATQITEVTIDAVATTAYTFNDSANTITFAEAPADESVILVSYISPETEVLYLIGAKVQDGSNDSPVTYSNNKFYILNDTLYANNNEVIDTKSYQDMINKTFNGQSLGSAAFVLASSHVLQENITIEDTYTGDGTTTEFQANNQIIELTSVTIDDVVQTEGTDYTFNATTSTVTFTTAPAAPVYNLLTTEPDDWATDYNNYFEKDENDNYIAVEGVAQYTSNSDSDWDSVKDNIWEFDGSNYIQLTTEPADWDVNYANYFIQSFVAPTFAVDTYYEYISSEIVLTYIAEDPDWDSGNVPTNNAVVSYTNTRISSLQTDLRKRLPNYVVAEEYNATTQDSFTGDGTTTAFTFTKTASGITTGFTFDSGNNQISFTSAPENASAILVDYTTPYSVGDYVMYDDMSSINLYRCISAITVAEVFTPAHWEVIKITELDKYAEIYSSAEKQVGTWIDGSALFEQTLTLSSLTASAATTVAHNISADTIFIKEGFTEYTVSNVDYSGMISNYKSTAGDEEFCVKIDSTNITYIAGTDLSNATAYITVRYTKPTV